MDMQELTQEQRVEKVLFSALKGVMPSPKPSDIKVRLEDADLSRAMERQGQMLTDVFMNSGAGFANAEMRAQLQQDEGINAAANAIMGMGIIRHDSQQVVIDLSAAGEGLLKHLGALRTALIALTGTNVVYDATSMRFRGELHELENINPTALSAELQKVGVERQAAR